MNFNRGGVYVAALDPVMGHEISKPRLVIIISNDINNKHSGTVTVLPITSQRLKKIYPFEVFLPQGSGNLQKNSKVKADQIRTLDKCRIVKFVGMLSGRKIEAVDAAVAIHLGLKT